MKCGWTNWVVIVCLICFFLLGRVFVHSNRDAINSWASPVVSEYRFTDWTKKDGYWQSPAYIYKSRRCEYVKGQQEEVTGKTKNGDYVYARIEYVGDETPGHTRPTGWQKMDKAVMLVGDGFDPGTEFKGIIIHQCGEGFIFSEYSGTVGENQEAPK